jgi:hypothetical protein
MNKFKTTQFPILGLVNYSKPYSIGKLNRQYISLLSACGISNEIFIKKQQQHFDMLDSMFSDVDVAIEILCEEDKFHLVNRNAPHQLLFDITHPDIQKALHEIRRKYVENPEKIRLRIPKSRNIYGVCDHTSTLNYGECLVRVTVRGEAKSIKGFVIVSKNPCYLRGDVRVLKAVDSSDYPQLRSLERDLVDCIVFPTKGRRPHFNEIAGSDLDGDQYFVR